MRSLIEISSYAILTYFILLEIQILVSIGMSFWALGKDQFAQAYGRLYDLLTSETAPPISIIMPAHNEEAGIVEAVRSVTLLKYPALEIVVVNDGSRDGTLRVLDEAFSLVPVGFPVRPDIPTRPIRQIYKSRLPVSLTVVDKENGGKSDAINAGINVARHPYVLAIDADGVLDDECLLRSARRIVEDRSRTVAVAGNVRPINGCRVASGKVIEVGLPKSTLEVFQVVEYIRSFLAARPGWSVFNALLLVSGAFGLFKKEAVVAVGGFDQHHPGEDFDLTMRLHRHFRDRGVPYRIVYASDAVVWTEVPATPTVLRRQRTRWHRGLMRVFRDHRDMVLNPRYGRIGLVAWPLVVLFEVGAPIVELLGWILIPVAVALGALNVPFVLTLLGIAICLGALNSIAALYLDERRFHYYAAPRETLRLLMLSLVENLGLRQRTVWWRLGAMLWDRHSPEWGDMERQGLAQV